MKGWVIVCFFLISCSNRKIESVVVRGSDTEVNLVLQLAETYMNAHDNVSVAVTGGGSGTGIASLLNKKTNIANSSRAFNDYELDLAKERDVDVRPFIFAVDALTFIANKNLNVDALSLDQIKDIYTGKFTNWSAVGGPDMPISLYGRQGNSGTFVFIQENILKGDYSQNMKQMNGTSQIVEGIKNDPAGIGYVGVGYLINSEGNLIDGIKVINLITKAGNPAVSPLVKTNILDGTYPVVRPLYQYLDGKPTGSLRDFLLFETSPEGQKIISDFGYFQITDAHSKINITTLSNE